MLHQLPTNQRKLGSQSVPLIPPPPSSILKRCIIHCVTAWHDAARVTNSPLMDFDDWWKWREHHGEIERRLAKRQGSDSTRLFWKMRRVRLFISFSSRQRCSESERGKKRCFISESCSILNFCSFIFTVSDKEMSIIIATITIIIRQIKASSGQNLTVGKTFMSFFAVWYLAHTHTHTPFK